MATPPQMQTPEKDEYSRTRQQMTAHIDVCMGGRVAEELIFGPAQVHIPDLSVGVVPKRALLLLLLAALPPHASAAIHHRQCSSLRHCPHPSMDISADAACLWLTSRAQIAL